MARYIDADKIDYTVTVVGEAENAGYRAVAFESDIDEMPMADVVEVVRCKDCESYNGHRYCNYHADPVMDDDFCSCGTPKERGADK